MKGHAPVRRVARHPESGYALLFVLMMAAVIAVMLYMQLPRVAFESQRDKEQLLIDRGEQYKRAIQLYVRKFNRFPPDINALENTQNIRFLRKQYIDPMTGKNEWRLIHVGPNGALTDSKIGGAGQGKDGKPMQQTLIADLSMTLGNTNGNQGVNQATRRRPSDDPNSPGDPNNAGPGGTSGSGTTGPVMVLPDGRIVPATSTGIPAPTTTTAPPAPGQPPQPGQPLQSAQAPIGGFQNTPNNPAGGAAGLINQILTTPRPGGFNGMGATDPNAANSSGTGFGGTSTTTATTGNNTGTPLGQTMGGTTVGGGIAGVASKMEQEGIKIYNSQTSYEKWEFVYDMSKDKSRNGGVTAPQQPTNPAQQSNQTGTQTTQPASTTPTTPSTGTTGTPD